MRPFGWVNLAQGGFGIDLMYQCRPQFPQGYKNYVEVTYGSDSASIYNRD
jgi:hypothetical protein